MIKTIQMFFTLSFIVLILFINCTDNPLDVTDNNYLNSGGTVILEKTLYPVLDTTYQTSTQLSTSFSNRLLLGEYNGIKSRIMLRFTNLPDSATFQEIKLEFFDYGAQCDDTTLTFQAKAHPITVNWETNLDDVWQNYTSAIDAGVTLGTMDVTATDNDIMDMDQAGLNQFDNWAIMHDSLNYGFLIDFSNANFMKYTASRNSSTYPYIHCIYTLPSDTTVYTDTLQATWDSFLYEGDQNRIPNRNYASSLTLNNTLLKFDLENFVKDYPMGVEVISANLILPVDTTNSVIDETYGPNFYCWKLFSDFNDPDIEVDSSSSRVLSLDTWSEDNKSLQIASNGDQKSLARIFIQPQLVALSGTAKHGFVINPQERTSTMNSFAFYKRTEPDMNLRPRLILKYHTPVAPRF